MLFACKALRTPRTTSSQSVNKNAVDPGVASFSCFGSIFASGAGGRGGIPVCMQLGCTLMTCRFLLPLRVTGHQLEQEEGAETESRVQTAVSKMERTSRSQLQ